MNVHACELPNTKGDQSDYSGDKTTNKSLKLGRSWVPLGDSLNMDKAWGQHPAHWGHRWKHSCHMPMIASKRDITLMDAVKDQNQILIHRRNCAFLRKKKKEITICRYHVAKRGGTPH